MQKIFIQKNEYKKNDKHPTHIIKLIPEDDADDQEWVEIGALWLTKAGDSWSGSFQDYFQFRINKELYEEKKSKGKKEKVEKTENEENVEW